MALALVPEPNKLPAVNPAASPLDQNPAAVYLARLAAGSRRTMLGALRTVARIASAGREDAFSLPWESLRYQHTQAVRAALLERFSPATVNKMLAAVRGVLRECWRLGLTNAEDFRRATDLEGVRGERLPRGRALERGELRALFAACADDGRPQGRRDAALLALLYGTGVRRSEAAALDLADYLPDSSELRVRAGKGRKERIVYLAAGATEAIADWLAVRGPDPGPLFYPVTKGGRVLRDRRTGDAAVRRILLRRAKQSGIARLSPHDLRRTFVGDLLDAGADLSTVQRLAGHANVATTARYDRRGEVAKRRAAGLLHIPYRAPKAVTLAATSR